MSAQRTDVDLSNSHMVMIEWDNEGWSVEAIDNMPVKTRLDREFAKLFVATLTYSDLDKINYAMNEDAF